MDTPIEYLRHINTRHTNSNKTYKRKRIDNSLEILDNRISLGPLNEPVVNV